MCGQNLPVTIGVEVDLDTGAGEAGSGYQLLDDAAFGQLGQIPVRKIHHEVTGISNVGEAQNLVAVPGAAVVCLDDDTPSVRPPAPDLLDRRENLLDGAEVLVALWYWESGFPKKPATGTLETERPEFEGGPIDRYS